MAPSLVRYWMRREGLELLPVGGQGLGMDRRSFERLREIHQEIAEAPNAQPTLWSLPPLDEEDSEETVAATPIAEASVVAVASVQEPPPVAPSSQARTEALAALLQEIRDLRAHFAGDKKFSNAV